VGEGGLAGDRGAILGVDVGEEDEEVFGFADFPGLKISLLFKLSPRRDRKHIPLHSILHFSHRPHSPYTVLSAPIHRMPVYPLLTYATPAPILPIIRVPHAII